VGVGFGYNCSRHHAPVGLARAVLFEQHGLFQLTLEVVMGLPKVVSAALRASDLAKLLNSIEEQEGRKLLETSMFQELQSALARFKEKPKRMVTVRMTESLHEELKARAHQERTSLNNLCVSKLRESVDQDLVSGSTSLDHPADGSDI